MKEIKNIVREKLKDEHTLNPSRFLIR